MNRSTGARAFTLLELLMAFGAGTILLGGIYFFHFGLVKAFNKTSEKFDLNTQAELTLETITRDLRMTHHVTVLKPDRIIIQKLPSEAVQNWEGFSPEKLRLVAVEYVLKKDKGHTILVRRYNMGEKEQNLFDVTEAKDEIFTGFVLDLPREKGDPFPRYRRFDMVSHPSEDLPRVTLFRIHLALKTSIENIDLISKVFLPLTYANVLQADWNVE